MLDVNNFRSPLQSPQVSPHFRSFFFFLSCHRFHLTFFLARGSCLCWIVRVVFHRDQWWLKIFHLKCRIKLGRTSADEVLTALMESSDMLSYQHRLALLSFSRLINRTLSSTWRDAIWCSHGLIISLTQNWPIYSIAEHSSATSCSVVFFSESGLTHKSRFC